MTTKKHKRRRIPSPSLTIASIALFVALGGVSYAAVTLPRNSVGAAQIRSSSIQLRHFSQPLVNKLAFADEIADAPVKVTLLDKQVSAAPSTVTTGELLCPSGMVALSGGASYEGMEPQSSSINATGNGWIAVARESRGARGRYMLLRVVCANGTVAIGPQLR